MSEIDLSVTTTFNHIDNIVPNGAANFVIHPTFPNRFLEVTGTFSDEKGLKQPLEDNIGIIAVAVNSVMPTNPNRKTELYALSRNIRNSVVAGIYRYGTIASRDDLFQEAVITFLEKRGKHNDDLGSFSTFILFSTLGALSKKMPTMSVGLKYPQQAYNKRPERLKLLETEEIPDWKGYGYDDDDVYLSRWVPADDIGSTPRYDILGEPSGEISDIVQNSTFIEALNSLPERNVEILTLYFTPHVTENGEAQPRTLDGVSEELGLGLSRERVRQIISSSIIKIRKKMIEIEKIKEQARIDLTKPKITSPEEREIIRQLSNKQRLQELAEAKLALGGMTINGVGVVIRDDELF